MHFNQSKLTSPLLSICFGYLYILILVIILYFFNFYENSTFFSYGVPVQFMGKTITDPIIYYILLLLFFIHQIINNWINSVVYPWIINCIQDPKENNTVYSKKTSMLIINMFALYSELDMIVIISGVMSQIIFFVVIILANIITTSIINWEYIKKKKFTTNLINLKN
jgi:hypothetical protein